MDIDLGSVIFYHSSSFIILKEIEVLFKDMYIFIYIYFWSLLEQCFSQLVP